MVKREEEGLQWSRNNTAKRNNVHCREGVAKGMRREDSLRSNFGHELQKQINLLDSKMLQIIGCMPAPASLAVLYKLHF